MSSVERLRKQKRREGESEERNDAVSRFSTRALAFSTPQRNAQSQDSGLQISTQPQDSNLNSKPHTTLTFCSYIEQLRLNHLRCTAGDSGSSQPQHAGHLPPDHMAYAPHANIHSMHTPSTSKPARTMAPRNHGVCLMC